jgi:hypothetical protein
MSAEPQGVSLFWTQLCRRLTRQLSCPRQAHSPPLSRLVGDFPTCASRARERGLKWGMGAVAQKRQRSARVLEKRGLPARRCAGRQRRSRNSPAARSESASRLASRRASACGPAALSKRATAPRVWCTRKRRWATSRVRLDRLGLSPLAVPIRVAVCAPLGAYPDRGPSGGNKKAL